MTRRTPIWVRGEATPDFLADPRRKCIGKQDLFFDESTIEAVLVCQGLCASCPVFQACTRWTLYMARQEGNPLEFGVFAGLTPRVRERIAAGQPYYDWRRDWHRSRYTKIRASRIYKTGRTSPDPRPAQPPCPYCGSPIHVRRHGRDRPTNRQRYQCSSCHTSFLGETL
jgi:hypothetical protein